MSVLTWYMLVFQFYANGKNAKVAAENLSANHYDQCDKAITRVYDDVRERVAEW